MSSGCRPGVEDDMSVWRHAGCRPLHISGFCTSQASAHLSLCPFPCLQVAEEVFLLSRVVRTFGTEDQEKRRYERCLSILRVIGVRQAAAYLMYLTTNSALFNLTKVGNQSQVLQQDAERCG